ncbi:MAG: phenylacetate--CoA ligase [Thermoplasmata archaeon]
MSRREIEAIRDKQLQWVVRHAYENNAFYRRKMDSAGVKPDDIKTAADLHIIPFTTKDELRSLYPYGGLAVSRTDVLEVHATSGTTGVPTLGFYTKSDIEVWAEVSARSLVMSGLTKEDVFQITPSFGMFTGGFGFYYGARKVGAMIVPTGAGFSKRQIQYMMDFGTTMISAVVSYVLRLTETAFEMGVDPARDTLVRKGVFGSEMWTAEMKKRIAETWDMDVYDIYGFTELCGPGAANDCYVHDGLHLWEDHFFVECVDPKTGEEVEKEEEGELVLTTLTKEGMPILRFRTHDLAFLYDVKRCECGRTHIKHSQIKGRTDDMIIISGTNVFPGQIEHVLMQNDKVGLNYRIIIGKKEDMDKLIVEVESKERLSEEAREELEKKLQNELKLVLLLTPEVKILEPGAIPKDSIKAKRVIDTR